MDGSAWGWPESRSVVQEASSALSQSRACWRSFAFATSLGGGEVPVVVGHPGDGEALEIVAGFVLAPDHGWKPYRQGYDALGQGDLLCRREPPVRPPGAQLVALAQHLQGFGVVTPLLKHQAKVVVGFGEIGLEPDRRAEFDDSLVVLALILQCVSGVLAREGVVGPQPDCLAESGLSGVLTAPPKRIRACS